MPVPDTTAYLFLGLAAIAVLVGGYLVSLLVRFANAQRDAVVLEELE
jgi:hypothetical protein